MIRVGEACMGRLIGKRKAGEGKVSAQEQACGGWKAEERCERVMTGMTGVKVEKVGNLTHYLLHYLPSCLLTLSPADLYIKPVPASSIS